jgi:hypothetical protein
MRSAENVLSEGRIVSKRRSNEILRCKECDDMEAWNETWVHCWTSWKLRQWCGMGERNLRSQESWWDRAGTVRTDTERCGWFEFEHAESNALGRGKVPSIS